MKILVLDTETTGLDHETDNVVEVALRYGLEDDADVLCYRVKPRVPITEVASKTHGITDEMTVDWPSFGEIADHVADAIRWAEAIVGYNPDFDIRMLKAEFRNAGVAIDFPKIVICSKRLWDIYDPPPPRHLQAAYAKFVDPAGFEGAHGATADTRATALVFRHQLEKFSLQDKPLAELDPFRALWWCGTDHISWAEDRSTLIVSFGKHSGKDVRELDGGYLRYITDPKKDFPAHVRELASRLAIHVKNNTMPNAARLAEWAARYEKENTR